MNSFFRFFSSFVLGGVVTLGLILLWFFSGVEITTFSNSHETKRNISTNFFKKDLEKVCQYLEKNGCKCEPVIDIGSSCTIKVPNLIGEVYLSSPNTIYYDQSNE